MYIVGLCVFEECYAKTQPVGLANRNENSAESRKPALERQGCAYRRSWCWLVLSPSALFPSWRLCCRNTFSNHSASPSGLRDIMMSHIMTTTQCLFAGLIKLMISKGFLGCYPSAPWHLPFWSLPFKPRVRDRELQGCATTSHLCQWPSQGYRAVSFYDIHTCMCTHAYISRLHFTCKYTLCSTFLICVWLFLAA